MNTEELLGQFTKVGLNVAGTYVEYHFKQYHASKDQSQKLPQNDGRYAARYQ